MSLFLFVEWRDSEWMGKRAKQKLRNIYKVAISGAIIRCVAESVAFDANTSSLFIVCWLLLMFLCTFRSGWEQQVIFYFMFLFLYTFSSPPTTSHLAINVTQQQQQLQRRPRRLNFHARFPFAFILAHDFIDVAYLLIPIKCACRASEFLLLFLHHFPLPSQKKVSSARQSNSLE